jgi:MFS transporter, DHA1 family, tetracycline resistance protein
MFKSLRLDSKLIFILVTMFLNFLGFSILFPILPFMVGKYIKNPHEIALYVGLLSSSYAFFQFFAAPGLGVLSDKFGRKPILLICLFGSIIGYLFLGFAGALWMLFAGRIIDGFTGGNNSTIYAYMADITKPEERGKKFGLLGAAAGVGMIIGPAIGGFFGSINLSLPLFIAAFITLLNLIFGFFVLQESLLSHLKSTNFKLTHLNPFHPFSHVFKTKVLKELFISGFIFFLAMYGSYSVNSVYLSSVFKWGPSLIGLLLFVIGFIDIFSQGFLVNKLHPKLGESKVAILGLILTSFGFFVASGTSFFAIPALMYFASITLNIGDGLFEPSQSGLVSKSVGPDMQGRIQGANQAMQSVARIIGPLFATFIFQFWKGLPYFTCGVLVAITLVVFILASKSSRS